MNGLYRIDFTTGPEGQVLLADVDLVEPAGYITVDTYESSLGTIEYIAEGAYINYHENVGIDDVPPGKYALILVSEDTE